MVTLPGMEFDVSEAGAAEGVSDEDTGETEEAKDAKDATDVGDAAFEAGPSNTTASPCAQAASNKEAGMSRCTVFIERKGTGTTAKTEVTVLLCLYEALP